MNNRLTSIGFGVALGGGILALISLLMTDALGHHPTGWAWTGLVVTVIGVALVLMGRYGMTDRRPGSGSGSGSGPTRPAV